MDPQPINKQQADNNFTQDKIIAMMRVTKKTDPSFKPLKKLKNAVQSIGYEKISNKPTSVILLFHFGLGNQLDQQFIKKTIVPEYLIKNSVIIPGKSYCFLNFNSSAEAAQYANNNFKEIIQGFSAKYLQLQHQNLSRVLVCMFAVQQANIMKGELADIADAPLHYQPGTIPGLSLIQNFISKQEQLQLLNNIDKAEWSKLNNRRVQHYGHQFKYGRNQVDPDQKYDKPLPQFMQAILQRLEKCQLLPGYRFDQITINDYFPGDGIPSHFDTHSPFQEKFVAISLLSGIVMQWRKFDGTQKQLYLPARSLVIFAGEGRYAWTHGISCRKMDKIDGILKHRSRRLSITLRKIKLTQCKCPYYFYCDSQGYDQKTMKKNNPLLMKYIAQNINNQKLKQKPSQQIYKKYVIDAYNGFGFDFHNRSIQGVEQLITQYLNHQYQQKNNKCTIILDVGCGNGQYKQLLLKNKYKNYYQYVGIEICKNMKQFDDKILMDGLSLSFRQYVFDVVLCVAVLHHMVNIEQRVRMLKQMRKVLADNGVIIISVFGYAQKQKIYKQQDILLDYCVSHTKINENTQNANKYNKQNSQRTEKRGEVYSRYYHLFKEQQIRQLCKQAGLKIVTLSFDKQNIIISAIKQQNKQDKK